jgi:hypothetical protein
MCIDNHVSLLLSNAIGVAMLTPSLPAVKASGRRSLASLSGTLHVPHQDVHTHMTAFYAEIGCFWILSRAFHHSPLFPLALRGLAHLPPFSMKIWRLLQNT